MKLSISQLRKIISEELEAELQEEKEGEQHFSSSQSPAQADKTFSVCMKRVVKTVKPDKGVTKEQAAARICEKTRLNQGAPSTWGKARRGSVQAARPGGLTGKEKKMPPLQHHKTHITEEK